MSDPAERERQELLDELRAAQGATQELLRAQDFLLRAARALAQAGDYVEALDRLAAVAVPSLADLCLIDVVNPEGGMVRMAARHADPAKQDLVDQLRDNYPPDPEGAHPSVGVLRSGTSSWSSTMSDEFLRATTRDEDHLALVRELQFTSYMAVPLQNDGVALGSLTLVSAGSGRRFGPKDLALAEELAGHAAAVIDRARRFDNERAIAHALQHSLLPGELPTLPGLTVAARYVPGTEGAEVGGDWYDVLVLADGAVGAVIGDVAGHDIGAAAEMGQLRNALRAYALRGDSPATVLDELRLFADLGGMERIATAIYLRLEAATGAVRVASAGHPPPLIRRRDGTVDVLAVVPAPPLGLASAPPAETASVVAPGESVILVTDGLIETRRRGIHEGIARLAELVAAAGDVAPGALCDHILDAAARSERSSDDVALLVIRRT